MIPIQILDDSKQPTTDFINGRPLVKVKAWINGDLVIDDGWGLVDPGSRHSAVVADKIDANEPEGHVPGRTTSGENLTGIFRIAMLQIDQFRQVPVFLTLMPKDTPFDVLIGRDALQHCNVVFDHPSKTYTLDMP